MNRGVILLFIGAALALGVGFVQLGAHQGQADALAQSVVAGDKAGGVIVDKERELAAHVQAHMKTNVSYELVGSYNRAVARAEAAVKPSSNGQIYLSAQAACTASRANSVVQSACVQHYLATHAAPAANPQVVAMPSRGDFTKTLSAPGWTADSTGLAFLAAMGSLVLGIYLLIVSYIKKASDKKRLF